MNKERYYYELERLYLREEQGEDITDELVRLDEMFNKEIDDEFHTDRLLEYDNYDSGE